MNLPQQYAQLMNAYDERILPPDSQIEMAQFLIDTGLNEDLRQYQQLCDYFIAEGMCYEVVCDSEISGTD